MLLQLNEVKTAAAGRLSSDRVSLAILNLEALQTQYKARVLWLPMSYCIPGLQCHLSDWQKWDDHVNWNKSTLSGIEALSAKDFF